MVLKKFIDEATGAWRNVSYGLNREDSFESGSPREYILKQLELETHDGDKFDIENIVVDFSYHESIESAFLRCDISIVDAVNFYQRLQGGEKIYINIVTATALVSVKFCVLIPVAVGKVSGYVGVNTAIII